MLLYSFTCLPWTTTGTYSWGLARAVGTLNDLPAFRLFSMVSSQYFSSLGFWPRVKRVIGDHPKYGRKKKDTSDKRHLRSTVAPYYHSACFMIASTGRPAPREQHLGSNHLGLIQQLFHMRGKGQTILPEVRNSMTSMSLTLGCYLKGVPGSISFQIFVDREDAGYCSTIHQTYINQTSERITSIWLISGDHWMHILPLQAA